MNIKQPEQWEMCWDSLGRISDCFLKESPLGQHYLQFIKYLSTISTFEGSLSKQVKQEIYKRLMCIEYVPNYCQLHFGFSLNNIHHWDLDTSGNVSQTARIGKAFRHLIYTRLRETFSEREGGNPASVKWKEGSILCQVNQYCFKFNATFSRPMSALQIRRALCKYFKTFGSMSLLSNPPQRVQSKRGRSLFSLIYSKSTTEFWLFYISHG